MHALLAQGQYEQAETVARARVDLARTLSGDQSLEAAGAADLLLEALLLNGRGAAPSTLMLAEQTLKNKEASLRRTDPDLAPSLIHLADALLEVPAYARAIASLERAVALRESAAPGVGLAEALDHLGFAYVSAGRYADARRVLERSLGIKESAIARADVQTARTLELKALALQRLGDYEQSGPAIRRAVTIQEKADANHPAYASMLNLLGLQLWFEGDLPAARRTSAAAVAVAERTLRPDHPTLALALRYLAGAAMDLGDIAEARSLLERGLKIAEQTLGPTHYETGAFLNDLAGPNRLLGAYPTARALYERSLKIAEARFGSWHDRVATAVHNLAIVDASLGDYASARREQVRATAIWEKVSGRNHTFVAVALTELASVYREQGSPADALPLLRRALDIRQRSLPPGHRDVAGTMADLAATLMQLGRPADAQDLATRALRILEKPDAPETPDLATVLALYAQLQFHRGDALAARQYYERSLSIRLKLLGSSHPLFADTQARLAQTLARLGDIDKAVQTAAAAETTGREHLRLMLRYLPERQSLNYAATRPRGLDLILSLTPYSPDASAIAFDELIRSRALVLDEMATGRAAGRTTAEEMAPLRAELALARQRLANLVVRGPGDLAPAAYVTLVEEARQASERAERALAEQSAAFRVELTQSQIGLDEVKASLPADSAVVAYVRYERTVVDGASRGVVASPAESPRTVTSYLAFVLRPAEQPVAIPLGASATIDGLVSRWREDIGAEALPTAVPSAVGRSSRASGTSLRKLLWDPIAPRVNDVSRIFVVPDGALNLVPFVALPVRTASYLLEDAPVIHLVSAERDLLSERDQRVNDGGLLAVGGPAFDDRAVLSPSVAAKRAPASAIAALPTRSAATICGGFQSLNFRLLDGARQEVEDVARVWSTPRSSADVQLLVGHDATERAFKQEAPRHRVLHVATHGFFLDDTCSPAIAGTRAVGGLVVAGRRPSRPMQSENPLVLSGLALAGANRRAAARADDEDGILTAEEVASLDLGGVEWAVLSACNTGLGEIKAGEGVLGLRRAFQIAGARTVIMSLWSVDDQATRSWMRALYEGRFQKGLSTADAVRAASLAVLQERRAKGQSTHPFYWAAFVAAGDWK
ncbi:MAG TPA: CHAT domain-containing protein [Vicinamibacterales bacterium]|nr:CHAT domain-containing protein [Vicinamibacterales bacterium]